MGNRIENYIANKRMTDINNFKGLIVILIAAISIELCQAQSTHLDSTNQRFIYYAISELWKADDCMGSKGHRKIVMSYIADRRDDFLEGENRELILELFGEPKSISHLDDGSYIINYWGEGCLEGTMGIRFSITAQGKVDSCTPWLH